MYSSNEMVLHVKRSRRLSSWTLTRSVDFAGAGAALAARTSAGLAGFGLASDAAAAMASTAARRGAAAGSRGGGGGGGSVTAAAAAARRGASERLGVSGCGSGGRGRERERERERARERMRALCCDAHTTRGQLSAAACSDGSEGRSLGCARGGGGRAAAAEALALAAAASPRACADSSMALSAAPRMGRRSNFCAREEAEVEAEVEAAAADVARGRGAGGGAARLRASAAAAAAATVPLPASLPLRFVFQAACECFTWMVIAERLSPLKEQRSHLYLPARAWHSACIIILDRELQKYLPVSGAGRGGAGRRGRERAWGVVRTASSRKARAPSDAVKPDLPPSLPR
jgi:hypothetical protein